MFQYHGPEVFLPFAGGLNCVRTVPSNRISKFALWSAAVSSFDAPAPFM
jgi:hypothetical protein